MVMAVILMAFVFFSLQQNDCLTSRVYTWDISEL